MPNKASPSLISPVANDIKLHGRSTAPAPSIGRASIIQIIIEKILTGKMHKFYEENCLVDQIYVRAENKETVKQYAGDIKVLSFERFKVGDGIEKKEEDFAAEVAAQING